MSSRFRFHGYAIGAAGHLSEPFKETIEVQAATALPAIGGRGTAKVVNFQCRDLVRFDLALSEVTGSDCNCKTGKWSAATHLKTTVEGLNIMGMVTADRIVANLVSTYDPATASQNSVKVIGTRFENLRIAGIPVKVDLATDVFDRHDTHEDLYLAYKEKDDVRKLIDGVSLRKATTPGMPLNLSLVRDIYPEQPGLDILGNVVHVPGFGSIRLAELIVSPATRVINMLDIGFDCPYQGRMMFMSVGDGGDPSGE